MERQSQLSTQPFPQEGVDQVMTLAAEVFGSPEKALSWLRSPHHVLANEAPLTMLETEEGRRLVESILWQLDEGIYT